MKLSLGVWSGLSPLPPGGDTCSTLGGRCEIVEPERHKAWRTVIILIFLCYLEIFFTTGRENQYRNHVLEVVKKNSQNYMSIILFAAKVLIAF